MKKTSKKFKGLVIAGSIILALALFCLGVALASRIYLLDAEANLANIVIAVYMVYGLVLGGAFTAVDRRFGKKKKGLESGRSKAY